MDWASYKDVLVKIYQVHPTGWKSYKSHLAWKCHELLEKALKSVVSAGDVWVESPEVDGK